MIAGTGLLSVWVPRITLSPHATWEYSWIRPPSRSRRRERISVASTGGSEHLPEPHQGVQYMAPRRRLASKARWSCMSAAYLSTIDRSRHPISRIRSPSDPPPASQSFAKVCRKRAGLESVFKGARSRTRHAVTPSVTGERYRDTRQQGNICITKLLDQSSSASAAAVGVFPGHDMYECARQDSNPRPAA
jgi:hypothetical protein